MGMGSLTSANVETRPPVRAAAILLENGRMLLVKQEVTITRHWSLPGGKLEPGETLELCLMREVKEETGLDARIKELLYVTDRITGNDHVVHMAFLVYREDDKPLLWNWEHRDPCPSKSSKVVREIRMALVEELTAYGFSSTFFRLVKDDFSGRGGYKGDFHAFYGEPR
jgi:ADP-ribose pyrophosphatase YjhB (NUDIX family)